ncbi:MAG: SRPBCC family protein [Phycisphaerae bacterium]|nr:SRPBCC family protein [Gemmatimonadaceae bacterium]
MNGRAKYAPGPAAGAEIRKNGDTWTLVVIRELRHPPNTVWQALTDPDQLKEWAPYDASRNLGSTGPASLTTIGAPSAHVTVGEVSRAEALTLLEFEWGGSNMRWELEPVGSGTRLTLWHNIGRKYIAMGAAGWQICFDVLERALDGEPIGRIVGGDAMQFEWPRLNAEYSEQFGIEPVAPTNAS